MKLFRRLWRDELGMVMSAEMVMLGTVGILAMTAGVGVMTTAVNDELMEMGQAFRSFDQSFEVHGYSSSYSGGVARGNGGLSSRALSSKQGSGFVQRTSVQNAINRVQMDYLPSRERHRILNEQTDERSMAAQRTLSNNARFAESAQDTSDQGDRLRRFLRMSEEEQQQALQSVKE